MSDITDVSIHVDPLCPWAWLTACWLAEVEKVRPVRVTTRLFSLAEVNRDKEESQRRAAAHAAGDTALRVLVGARRRGGNSAMARLYAEIGEAHQERGEALDDLDVLRACARSVELDPGVVEAALADESTFDELLEEHRAAVARGAFGVPTLIVGNGPATFGPCVDTRITGKTAGQLWDRVAWLLGAEHFFELKRRRGRADIGRYKVAASSP